MKTLVIGNIYVDVIINIDKLPRTGDDILCKKQLITVGGCAYNVATILKNFDIDHDLLFPVGKGTYSDIIRKEVLKLIKENEYKIKRRKVNLNFTLNPSVIV